MDVLQGIAIFANDICGENDIDDPRGIGGLLKHDLGDYQWPTLTPTELTELNEFGRVLLSDIENSDVPGIDGLRLRSAEALAAAEDAPNLASVIDLALDWPVILGFIFLVRLHSIKIGSMELKFSNDQVAEIINAITRAASKNSEKIDAALTDANKKASE